MSRVPARWIVSLCFVAGLVPGAAPGAAPAQAQDDEAFKRGLDALEDRRWAEAATRMREAIEADPKESTRRVGTGLFGLNRKSYLPYYFLGEALFNQNDCAGAIGAWDNSEQQRVVIGQREYNERIQKGYAVCAARGVLPPQEYTELFASVEQSLRTASAVSTRVTAYGNQHLDLWQSRSDWGTDYGRAVRDIEQARKLFMSATRTRLRSEFNAAKALTDPAVDILVDLERRVAAAVDSVQMLRSQIDGVKRELAEAQASDRALEGLNTRLPDVIERSRRSAQAMIDTAAERLAAGTKDQNAAVIGEAQKLAREASVAMAKVLADARAIVKEQQARQLANEVASVDGLLEAVGASFVRLEALAAQRPRQTTPESVEERALLRKQFAAARRRYEQARAGENLAGVQQASRVMSDLQQKVAGLLVQYGPLTLRDRGVPAALEDAARLFLAGEYRKVLDALEDPAWDTSGTLAAHGHLLKAASLYMLFLRSGERDRELRTQAAAAVGEVRERAPDLAPDERVFSRRFVGFYRSTGQGEHRAEASAR